MPTWIPNFSIERMKGEILAKSKKKRLHLISGENRDRLTVDNVFN